MTRSSDVVVIGGGLGGLAAACLLARAGRKVTLFERAFKLGGRAASQTQAGYILNEGAHALYRRGAAMSVLRALGIRPRGGVPATRGVAVAGGRTYRLPASLRALVTTRLLPVSAKWELLRLLRVLPLADPAPLSDVTVDDWLGRTIRHPAVRSVIGSLVRLTTYADDPARMSAGAVLDQLRRALSGNVLYLDGGWQSLVDALAGVAAAAGVELRTGEKVVAIEHDDRVRSVQLANRTAVQTGAVVVAGSPAQAEALAPGVAALSDWARTAIPVEAACLDVALARLPRPEPTFALGIDQPLYFSVHSKSAQLAPAGGAVVQLMRYLGPTGSAPADDRAQLEQLFDLVQPGWRRCVVSQRFLPRMTVAHALPAAATRGLDGRPGPEVPGVRGLYVVGDWVGPEGLLADASLASARRSAALIAGSATSVALESSGKDRFQAA